MGLYICVCLTTPTLGNASSYLRCRVLAPHLCLSEITETVGRNYLWGDVGWLSSSLKSQKSHFWISDPISSVRYIPEVFICIVEVIFHDREVETRVQEMIGKMMISSNVQRAGKLKLIKLSFRFYSELIGIMPGCMIWMIFNNWATLITKWQKLM